MLTETLAYFGPVTALAAAAEGGRVRVQLPGGEVVAARMALAVPYLPAAGDELLYAAGPEGAGYVIGVIRSTGAATIRFRGDVRIESEGTMTVSGETCRVHGERTADVAAPRIVLRGARVELLARRLVERIGDAFVWATGLFQVKAKRLRSVSTGEYLVKAQRAHFKSDADFSINGRTIHLG